MDRRLNLFLLSVAVASGALASPGAHAQSEAEAVGGSAQAPQVVEPQVERRVVKPAAVPKENFEIGAWIGGASIEDFGTNVAYGARLALHRRGMRVPEDVSLVGFDDQAPSAYMIPPLTSVRRPPLEIGEAAGRALVDLMQGKSITLPKFKSTLMIRESVIRRF